METMQEYFAEECPVCLISHDGETHAATLRVRGYLREQVRRGGVIQTPAKRPSKLPAGVVAAHEAMHVRNRRNDITVDQVAELIKQNKPVMKIAMELRCSEHAVRNRKREWLRSIRKGA